MYLRIKKFGIELDRCVTFEIISWRISGASGREFREHSSKALWMFSVDALGKTCLKTLIPRNKFMTRKAFLQLVTFDEGSLAGFYSWVRGLWYRSWQCISFISCSHQDPSDCTIFSGGAVHTSGNTVIGGETSFLNNSASEIGGELVRQ